MHKALQQPLILMQATMGDDEDMYRFAEEFIASVNRVNYNQDNRINALAGKLLDRLLV